MGTIEPFITYLNTIVMPDVADDTSNDEDEEDEEDEAE